MVAAGGIGWRKRDGIDKRPAGEQSGKRIGQCLSSLNVMHSALRWNIHWRIGGASAKVVFAVRASAEIGGVAVQPELAARLNDVPPGNDGEALLSLEEVAVGGHDRSTRDVETLVESVVELDRRIGVVRRRKLWCGPGKADGALKGEAWRDGAGVSHNAVALVVNVGDSEGRVDRGLVWIGGWPEEVVEVEPGHELRLVGELVIEAKGELVGVGYYLG
jgi:hypothetical protein